MAATVRVKDGIALARGSKTPLLRKCEGERAAPRHRHCQA